jgi:hypothetical protein
MITVSIIWAVSRWSVAAETVFDPRAVHVGFVVGTVSIKQGFLQELQFSSVLDDCISEP